MLESLFYDNVWLAMIVWAAIYISDYYLTIRGARLYQSAANQYIVYEGSYELTPSFQKDINALRRLSPRFLRALFLSLLVIPVIWALSVSAKLPGLFSLWMGFLILLEAAVHLRHFRNIVLFSLMQEPGVVEGKIQYRRWATLRSSALELLSFAVLWLLLSAVNGSWFFVGGALGCARISYSHWRMAAKVKATAATPPVASEGAQPAPAAVKEDSLPVAQESPR